MAGKTFVAEKRLWRKNVCGGKQTFVEGKYLWRKTHFKYMMEKICGGKMFVVKKNVCDEKMFCEGNFFRQNTHFKSMAEKLWRKLFFDGKSLWKKKRLW